MSIFKRIWLGFTVICAALILVGLLIFLDMRSVENSVDNVSSDESALDRSVSDMQSSVLLYGQDMALYLSSEDPSYLESSAGRGEDFRSALGRFEAVSIGPEDERLVQELSGLFDEYQREGEALSSDPGSTTGFEARQGELLSLINSDVRDRVEESGWTHGSRR
ncbi:MAG: MCP four helix bundle domain-containing protein [Rubrobacter sp.]